MKLKCLHFILPFLLMTTLIFAQKPIRVACVGDSITYGDKILFRAFRSYPAVLQKMAEGRFSVGNFGVNGATALELQGRAWTGTEACREALEYQPDIVIIMLGINDLFFPDRYSRYPDALRKVVKRFQDLPSSPRIFLCTLTPLAPADRQAEANQTIRTVFNPAIRQVAAETGAQLIDIHAVFPPRVDLLPDGVHPNPEGAALIARTILKAIDESGTASPQIHPAPKAGPVDLSIRNEAFAARNRATRWLKGHPPPTDLPDPGDAWTGHPLQSPDEVADLLPLLAGETPSGDPNAYRTIASLAIALDSIGQETVFLGSNRPVAWREALLHQLVQRQKMDAGGGGYWASQNAKDPAADRVRSTTYALQAITIALGE